MKTRFTVVALAGAAAIMAGGCAEVPFPDMTNGQGEMAGEVTPTSVILPSRLTVGRELVEGDRWNGGCGAIRDRHDTGVRGVL